MLSSVWKSQKVETNIQSPKSRIIDSAGNFGLKIPLIPCWFCNSFIILIAFVKNFSHIGQFIEVIDDLLKHLFSYSFEHAFIFFIKLRIKLRFFSSAGKLKN